MLKHLILAGSALALTTAIAMAQASPEPGSPPATGATTTAPPGGGSDQRATRGSSEFQAIQSVKIPLSQAITTAEQQSQGRAISAEFEEEDGRDDPAHYAIKVVQGDGKLMEFDIDANTGAVIESENQPFERYFTRLKPADFQNARTSLKDAIAMAEQRSGGGKVIEAEVERENNTVVYEIELATADRSQEVKIDANGQFVSTD